MPGTVLLLLMLCFAAVCARAAEGPALHAAEPHAASAAAPRLLPVTSPVSLDWAGRSWSVKTGVALPGPGAGSHYEPSHAWVDAAGGLHLKVAPSPGAADCSAWSSAEVWTNAPLGYGTYEVQVTAPRFLDPFTTFGFFTWDDDSRPETGGGAAGHRELDFELGVWGDVADADAGQFVVQPWTAPANLQRWALPAALVHAAPGASPRGAPGAPPADCADPAPDQAPATVDLTFTLRWAPGRAAFELRDGLGAGAVAAPIAQWAVEDAARVPTAGEGAGGAFGPRVHINLWLNDPSGAPLRYRPVHVVIHSFAYTPLPAARQAAAGAAAAGAVAGAEAGAEALPLAAPLRGALRHAPVLSVAVAEGATAGAAAAAAAAAGAAALPAAPAPATPAAPSLGTLAALGAAGLLGAALAAAAWRACRWLAAAAQPGCQRCRAGSAGRAEVPFWAEPPPAGVTPASVRKYGSGSGSASGAGAGAGVSLPQGQ